MGKMKQRTVGFAITGPFGPMFLRGSGDNRGERDFQYSGGGANRAEGLFGRTRHSAVHGKHDGEALSGRYGFTGFDGGKGAHAK